MGEDGVVKLADFGISFQQVRTTKIVQLSS
jgi:hypothetical protein